MSAASSDSPLMEIIEDLPSLRVDNEPEKRLQRIKKRGASLMIQVPVCSDREPVNHAAKQVIQSLPGDKSQFYPFVNDEERYYLLVAETIDCLDHERSDHSIYYNKDAEKSIRIIKCLDLK
jgi:hypothetical protein